MANRWSVASGLASAASTWDGGASVPVSGDRVLISAGTTVTLDGTYEWGDDSTATISVNGVSTTASITVQAGGTLQHSTSVSSQLTTFGGMNVFGTYNAGTAATPMPQGVTATLIVGRQTTPVADRIYADFLDGSGASFVGVTRKRLTTLTATANAAATSIAVTNATGWQVGDELYICQTDSGGDKRYDIGVIAAGYVSGNLTVPLTAALGFQHLSGCDVANMTSNVTAKSYYSTAPHAGMTFRCGPTGTSNQRDFSHAAFENFYGRYNRQGVTIECIDNVGNGNENFSATPWANSFSRIDSCAFVRRSTTDQYVFCPMGKTFDVPLSITNCFVGHANKTAVGQIYFEGAPTFNGCLFAGIFTHGSARPCYITNSVFNGCVDAVNQACIFTQGVAVGNLTVSNTKFYGRTGCATVNYGTATVISNYVFDNCDIGYTFPIGASTLRLTNSQTNNATMAISYVSCRFQASLLSTPTTIFSSPPALTAVSQIDIVNRDTDVTKQEIHKRDWSVYRDTTTNRSVSSIKITPKALSTNCTRTQSIACANGASIRVVGYVRRVTGTTTATVTISGTIAGVSITTQTFTASAASIGAWERYVLVATNTTGNDGNLTLTYTANASSLTTPDVYFDGVTDAPFVTKARHFGFLYDESLPTRTVNQTVTLTNYTPTATSLGTDETTAIGIGGMTVTGGVSVSPLALTASRTFQQVYDYTQAWGAANLTSALPLTGVGIAGSPSLFAAANVTTTGFTLNGSGSLSMGAYTLTANQPWAYTYTGGTFSQASTVPSFSGGTLTLSTAGTKTFNMTGGQVTFSVAGTSDLSTSTFAGNVNLVNTSGGTVNITLAGGQSYTNTGPNINITAATINQGLSFTGLVNGSEVYVFDTGTQTVIASTTNVTGNAFLWQQTWAADKTVDYTIYKDGYIPIRVAGVLAGQGVQSVPVTQVADRAYITPSGLTFGTTATANVGTSRFTVTVATTVQNWYSFMVQSWRTQSTLKNKPFPLSSNGPNSFTLEGWEFSSGVSLLKQDGMRYTSSGAATAVYAALYSVDTAAGLQIKYQQTDGGTTTNAANTGKIDQLVQVYGDATHGNFDYRSFLALKVQADGYDQAEADVVATYGNLEDQLYIIGLNPLSNGLATGAPTVNGAPTITDHGATPVTWNSKQFSITITDSAAGNTGATLMRWIRYNLGLGGTFQGKAAFNWHDLVQTNGSAFKTVRGAIYGDTGAALKGVRVLTNAGGAHPDFSLFTADDGTTYAPPPSSTITITGVIAGSRVQIYDTANNAQLLNSTSTYTYTETFSVARTIRIRVSYVSGTTAKKFIEATIGSTSSGSPNITYNVSQEDDATYNSNGVNGPAIYASSGITFTDAGSADLVNCNIPGGTVGWPTIYACFVYWNFTPAGIANDFVYIDAPDTGNYLLTSMKVKNTSATPLIITDGYGKNKLTGLTQDAFDITGGYIFPAPAHVVPYATGSGVTAGDVTNIASATAAAVWSKTLP